MTHHPSNGFHARTASNDFLEEHAHHDATFAGVVRSASLERILAAQQPARSQEPLSRPMGSAGSLFYTVDEGERVLRRAPSGTADVIVGPRRIWIGRSRIEPLAAYAAHPGDYLVIHLRDGRQLHLRGPTEAWLDPRVHRSITVLPCLDLATKEAVVVYQDQPGGVVRRIVEGPALFMPAPNERLHTFSWHGSIGGPNGFRKVPNALVFQKLILLPDQLYHDVEEVRTADDAVVTVRLMIFFELVDIERMLASTHDPIGDLINAATAGVVEFAGERRFEEFKGEIDRLSQLSAYAQLNEWAKECGYRIPRIVHRGYWAPPALQKLQQEALEARQHLEIEAERERRAELVRREQREHLAILGQLGVDLTAYLTQGRADQVIEVRRRDD